MTPAEVDALRESVRAGISDAIRERLFPTLDYLKDVWCDGSDMEWQGPEVVQVCKDEWERAQAALGEWK